MIEDIKGSEVPNMDLIFQIYNLLQLMTYSIAIGKPLSHFHDDHTWKQPTHLYFRVWTGSMLLAKVAI